MPSTTTKKQSTKDTSTDPWAFTIEKSRFGLYTSYLSDGTPMTTGLTEEACRWVTLNIRIPVLRGEFDGYTSEFGRAVVEGKL